MEINFNRQREKIVAKLESYGSIRNDRIKKAMLKVKREQFVPKEYIQDSYVDTPLPIPGNVTISAPHN